MKRIAEAQEWTFAEAVRRALEKMVRVHPAFKDSSLDNWQLPEPLDRAVLMSDPEELKDALRHDGETENCV
ncbi:MAG: hypothetical protein LBK99_21115 [Opitutaceae bacterium]|nr:hypothetical protein [Opitutaceae bacterium]